MHDLERRLLDGAELTYLAGVTSIVGVSGGPDSVALLRLLASPAVRSQSEGSRIVVGHFNHGARPAAEDDERFVGALAESLQLPLGALPCESAHDAESPEDEPGHGRSEEEWRQRRYAYLTELAHHYGARYLLLGHTADDQAETVLFNALRGSGLRGLCGIPEVRMLDESLTLKRPLLNFERKELVAYLQDLNQEFRTDETNLDISFSRNRIRHELLPQIETVVPGDPRVALRRLSAVAREALDELQPTVDQALDRAVQQRGSVVEIDCLALQDESSFVIRECTTSVWRMMQWSVKDMSHAKWCQLANIVRSPNDAHVIFPGEIVLTKHQSRLQLAQRPDESQ